MTQTEYWRDVNLLSLEIEDAIAIVQTYEEIGRLAREDPEILLALNKEPLFWNVQVYSLQTSLFILLGRIFDQDPAARSIHTVVSATLGHLDFFSREALRARKVVPGTPEPDWLDGFVAAAWVPDTVADLRHLKKCLAPYQRAFEQVYRPIRHKIVAHRVIKNPEEAFDLFTATNRTELISILDFLHDLMDAIENLYLNGIRPKLGARSYSANNKRIKDQTGNVLKRLAASYSEKNSRPPFDRT